MVSLLFVAGLLVAPASAPAPVRFAVVADNRDAPGFASVLQSLRAIEGGPGGFLVIPGDLDPAPATAAAIDCVLGPGFPWFPAIGNHDFGDAANLEFVRRHIREGLAGRVRRGPPGSQDTTYSFDAGPVHVAVIDEYWNGLTAAGSEAAGDATVVPALRSWLAADLVGSHRPWKLVVGHEPAYPQPDRDLGSGRHLTTSLNQYPAARDAFWKMLEAHDVGAYLCGHTHRYSRFRPPGSTVWQIDAGQARDGPFNWRFDAFLVITADRDTLRVDTYRHVHERGRFERTDWLVVRADGSFEEAGPAALPPRR
ncbi:MAG: metallophosphoesterase family protein [Acidobacteriota bacterium]